MVADFRPTQQLAELTRAGVDFVVIGGIAATMHGSTRDTFDLDICPLQSHQNLDLLGTALIKMEARLRGVEEDVPFAPDGHSLKGLQILTLDTRFGPLDVLMRPDGSPPYSRLRNGATQMDMGGTGVRVASIDALLEMKRRAGRHKDLADVEELEAIKRLNRRLRQP
jgi:predicted nucleotidyltransferase